MTRLFTTVAIAILSLALTAPMAEAQGPNIQITGNYGFGGGFSPYGGFGFSPYGGYGYGIGPYGGFGHNPYPGFGGFPGGFGYGGLRYGPFNYSQQLFQQQASLTQQIFQQKQLAILGQIQAAESRLEGLEATKQQLFQQYLEKNDTEKTAVRAGLIRDFLGLNPAAREAWKRDTVIQIIIGQDLERLDGLAEFREMSEPDKDQFRQAMLEKYRTLPAADRQAWQKDQIVGNILGRDWWLK